MRGRARRGVVLALALAACACHRQSDFDERYQQQSQQAMEAASSMEEELQTRLDASSAAGHGVAEHGVAGVTAQGAPTAP
jgi:hypothetical protein